MEPVIFNNVTVCGVQKNHQFFLLSAHLVTLKQAETPGAALKGIIEQGAFNSWPDIVVVRDDAARPRQVGSGRFYGEPPILKRV